VSVSPARHQPHFERVRVIGETLAGAIDGVNTVFTTANKFDPVTIAAYLNGLRLHRGAGLDFTVAESGGPGSGYDTLMLWVAPISLGAPHTDIPTADYTIA